MSMTRDIDRLSGLSSAPGEMMLSRADLAVLVGCTTRTVRRWELRAEGPPRVTVAGRPRYVLAAVREWIEAAGEARAA